MYIYFLQFAPPPGVIRLVITCRLTPMAAPTLVETPRKSACCAWLDTSTLGKSSHGLICGVTEKSILGTANLVFPSSPSPPPPPLPPRCLFNSRCRLFSPIHRLPLTVATDRARWGSRHALEPALVVAAVVVARLEQRSRDLWSRLCCGTCAF